MLQWGSVHLRDTGCSNTIESFCQMMILKGPFSQVYTLRESVIHAIVYIVDYENNNIIMGASINSKSQ